LTKGTLHCGVTSESLLSKKAYKEFLEPLAERMEAVSSFLKAFNPRLKINVFELTDTAGVGGALPEVQACILTRETAKGGEILNVIRKERGLKECELVFVDMILADLDDEGGSQNFSNKSSSTQVRKFLAEQQK
jgi:pantetheine-phosphate adenylyltransferase